MSAEKQKYGVHSEAGKLRKVMVCSPGLAHQRLTPNNCDELLFDDVLWVAQAKRDHFDFVGAMGIADELVFAEHARSSVVPFISPCRHATGSVLIW